ncbi:hypothetical protein H8D85_00750 [bacterium]|nr:hypothetical protein [bacterium]
MHKVETVEDLPQPVRAMARNFLKADLHEPEIYEVGEEEYDSLATGDVVTQLLYWRKERKFYAVLAGDADRKIQSQIIIHDPYFVKTSILAFYEVDDSSIKVWKAKYGDKMLDNNILEMK